MTGQELLDVVKGNLGDRQSGRIGSLPTDTAIMVAINRAVNRILKKYRPQGLQETISQAITTATYIYAPPSPTIVGRRIRDIINARMILSGETTGTILVQLMKQALIEVYPNMDSSRTEKPRFFTKWAGKYEYYGWPNDNYAVYFFCNLWPADITVAATGTDLGVDWDETIEAFATFHCFAKLQQTQDAQAWYGIFRNSQTAALGELRDQPAMVLDGNLRDLVGGDRIPTSDARDPFVRSL